MKPEALTRRDRPTAPGEPLHNRRFLKYGNPDVEAGHGGDRDTLGGKGASERARRWA